jgi:hypothetical protein
MDEEEPKRSLPSDLVIALRRLGSAILTQDASTRALLAMVERGLDEDSKSHERLERLLRSIEQSQYEIRECLRITQVDMSTVKETTGKHALIEMSDEELSIQIRGKAKVSDVFKSTFQLLWKFKLLWAAGGGVAVVKAIEKILPLIGGH